MISNITLPEKKEGIVYAEKPWIATASEYVLHPRNIPSKFPSVLPYFEVLNRCMEIESMLESIIRWNASHMKIVKPVMDLYGAVGEIMHEPKTL